MAMHRGLRAHRRPGLRNELWAEMAGAVPFSACGSRSPTGSQPLTSSAAARRAAAGAGPAATLQRAQSQAVAGGARGRADVAAGGERSGQSERRLRVPAPRRPASAARRGARQDRCSAGQRAGETIVCLGRRVRTTVILIGRGAEAEDEAVIPCRRCHGTERKARDQRLEDEKIGGKPAQADAGTAARMRGRGMPLRRQKGCWGTRHCVGLWMAGNVRSCADARGACRN